jgi:hypothetical protein
MNLPPDVVERALVLWGETLEIARSALQLVSPPVAATTFLPPVSEGAQAEKPELMGNINIDNSPEFWLPESPSVAQGSGSTACSLFPSPQPPATLRGGEGLEIWKITDLTPDQLDWLKFPDGDITRRVQCQLFGEIRSTGWIWNEETHRGSMSKSGSSITLNCGGVMACPDCPYRSRPYGDRYADDRKKKPAKRQRAALRRNICHGLCLEQAKATPLTYVECNCVVTYNHLESHWTIIHRGVHQHDRPPVSRENLLEAAARRKKNACKQAPSVPTITPILTESEPGETSRITARSIETKKNSARVFANGGFTQKSLSPFALHLQPSKSKELHMRPSSLTPRTALPSVDFISVFFLSARPH